MGVLSAGKCFVFLMTKTLKKIGVLSLTFKKYFIILPDGYHIQYNLKFKILKTRD